MVDVGLEAEVVIAAALGREPCLERGADFADEASLAEHERVVDVEQNEDNEALDALERNAHEEAAVERRACEARITDQEHGDQVVPDRARVLVTVKVISHAENIATRVVREGVVVLVAEVVGEAWREVDKVDLVRR